MLACKMTIENYEIPVHLGCSQEERSLPQLVSFQIELSSPQNSTANKSDQLNDAICYASLCGIIGETVGTRHFHLLEFLAQEVFNQVRKSVPANTHLVIQAHKLYPPIDRLRGGVKYRIEGSE